MVGRLGFKPSAKAMVLPGALEAQNSWDWDEECGQVASKGLGPKLCQGRREMR